MVSDRVLSDRAESLGLTNYAVAKKTAEIRQDGKSCQQIQSSVNKVLSDPNGVSVRNFQAVVAALGGELVIRWQVEKVEVVEIEERL